MTNEDTEGARLRLPVQAAPVDRTPAAHAALGGPGIEASASWTDLIPDLTKPQIVDFAPPLFTL